MSRKVTRDTDANADAETRRIHTDSGSFRPTGMEACHCPVCDPKIRVDAQTPVKRTPIIKKEPVT